MTPERFCKEPPGQDLHMESAPELLGQDYRNSTLPSTPKGEAAGYGEANPSFLLEMMNEYLNTFENLPVEQERCSIVRMGGHYIVCCKKNLVSTMHITILLLLP